VLRVGLISTGAFGRDVSRVVEDCADVRAKPLDVSALSRADTGWPWPGQRPDAIVTVTWRPSDAMCERLDAHAFAAGVPWLPACLEHPYLSVGPWVLPPHGPCFRCVRARLSQHMPPGAIGDVARRAYDADPACGPLGHLPSHARLVGGLILQALAGLVSAPLPSGPDAWRDDGRLRMVRYQMGNGRFTSHQVIPCDSCPRCDQPGPRAVRQRRIATAFAEELTAAASGGASR
jgi:bacteriocin biosynthesis cyclodehydratase domain-containing protein